MVSSRFIRRLAPVSLLILILIAVVAVFPAGADELSGSSRAAWLLNRIDYAPAGVDQGQFFQTDEFGYISGPISDREKTKRVRKHSPWLLLASAVVPGSGELMMGKWIRGVSLIGADAYFWHKVQDAGDEGRELEDEYYTFADDHCLIAE